MNLKQLSLLDLAHLYVGITEVLPHIQVGDIVHVTYNQDWGPKLYMGSQRYFDKQMIGSLEADLLILKPNTTLTYLGFVQKAESTYSKLLFNEKIFYLYLRLTQIKEMNAQFRILT